MKRSLKVMLVGALALAGVSAATVETEAMPLQPLQSTALTAGHIENVWWRGGYGRRGYGWRGYGWRGYGWRGYGWRGPFVGYRYGWGRPWGYGWRRPWGWRRW